MKKANKETYDFLRWVINFSNKFSGFRYNEASKRWHFIICNESGETVHLEMYTDRELWDRYLEEKEEQK